MNTANSPASRSAFSSTSSLLKRFVKKVVISSESSVSSIIVERISVRLMFPSWFVSTVNIQNSISEYSPSPSSPMLLIASMKEENSSMLSSWSPSMSSAMKRLVIMFFDWLSIVSLLLSSITAMYSSIETFPSPLRSTIWNIISSSPESVLFPPMSSSQTLPFSMQMSMWSEPMFPSSSFTDASTWYQTPSSAIGSSVAFP